MIRNILGISSVVFTLIIGYFYQLKTKNNIKENGILTVGRITDVDDGGVEFDLSVTYEYLTIDDIYSRKVELDPSDKFKFKNCDRSSKKCRGGLVWVIYSKDAPKKSLVNLDFVFDSLHLSEIRKPVNFCEFY